MTRARRRHLIVKRWHRYLWLDMRHEERYLARTARDIRDAGWRVSAMRLIDQEWRFLQ